MIKINVLKGKMKTTQETTLYILLTSNRNSLTTTTRNKQISNTNEKLKTTQDQLKIKTQK